MLEFMLSITVFPQNIHSENIEGLMWLECNNEYVNSLYFQVKKDIYSGK